MCWIVNKTEGKTRTNGACVMVNIPLKICSGPHEGSPIGRRLVFNSSGLLPCVVSFYSLLSHGYEYFSGTGEALVLAWYPCHSFISYLSYTPMRDRKPMLVRT